MNECIWEGAVPGVTVAPNSRHRSPSMDPIRQGIIYESGEKPDSALALPGHHLPRLHGPKARLYHFLERCIHSMILTQLGAARLAGAVREMDPTAFE